MHEFPLLTTIAAAFTSAWILGIITQKLGLSPIVGYLLAGIAIGPSTPGFSGDPKMATELAEVGVILLMFGVGLHFHLKDLLAVRTIAIPGAIVQSAVATGLGMVVFWGFGWSSKAGLAIGMATAVASTVVLLRVLNDNKMLDTAAGHAAVGWLIVEDLLTVVILVLIPTLATARGSESLPTQLWSAFGVAVLKLGGLVVLVPLAGSRVIPWMFILAAKLRSRELFTLTVLVVSIAVATGSAMFFGTSVALGAFLAGMVVGQSPVSQQAGADALPLRDAFAVIFFVSVGMLFRPTVLIEQPLMVLAGLGIVLVAKPLVALAVVAVLGHSSRLALTVAVGLAQIGEFSFILSELAARNGLLPAEGHDVIVATAIVSITLNPMLFRSVGRMEQSLKARPKLWHWLNHRAERQVRRINEDAARLASQSTSSFAVVVGYGPVGSTVDRVLRERGISTVVIDLNMDTVRSITAAGRAAIFGDASQAEVLRQAGIQRASHLVVTLPHSSNRAPLVAAAREMNPDLKILVRARYLAESVDLTQAGATAVMFEEAEAAIVLARMVLVDAGADTHVIEAETARIRDDLFAAHSPQ